MKAKDLSFKGLVLIFEALISCHKPNKQHKHHKPIKYPKKKTKIIQSENQSQKCPEKTITTRQEKRMKKNWCGERKKKIGVRKQRKRREEKNGTGVKKEERKREK